MRRIKSWLAPPIFPEDEIKTHRANTLNYALIIILMLEPVILIGDLLGGKTPLPVLLANVLSLSFCLVLRWWMHRGRMFLASVGLITMGFILITASAASLGTIRTPTTAMYLLIVIIGGLLFDLRGMVITTAITSFLIGGLILAEIDGLLPRPDYSITITQWIAYTVISAWTGSLTFISLQTMRRALMRADKELIDRKAAEEALIKSENLLNETQHITKSGGWEYDVAAGKITWTQEVYRIYGVTPEDYDPNDRDPDIEFYAPEDKVIIKNAFKGAVEEGISYDLELRVKNKSREYMWIRIIGKPERKDGKIVRIYGNIVDITQRKRVGEELLANQEHLRTIIETEPECVKVVAANGKLVSMNRAGLDMIECENIEEVIGASVYDLIAPDYLDAWRAFHESICQGKKGELQFVMLSLKGNRHWMETHAAPIRNPTDGTLMQLAVTIDITERKQVEEELNLAYSELEKKVKDLEESRQSYRMLAENFPGIVYRVYLRENNRRQFFNTAALSTTGYVEEDLTEPFLSPQSSIILPVDRERVVKLVESAIAENKPFAVEFQIKHKNGNILWMLEQGKPIYGEDNKPLYVEGVIFDITERKKAQKQIEASLKEKEILLREIHHRVKNNLQIISSLLGLQSISIKNKAYLEMFKDSQNRINSISLIHDKLYRSKDLAEIDFKEYIKDLTTKLYQTYAGKGSRIKLILNIDNVTLGIDQAIPCGLIINELITNSFKHAFPQDRAGEIKISLRRIVEHIELIASDNGIGIPDRIDFQKTQSLGLHLVTILVDQLNGRIDLDRSGGTEFKIIFKGGK